MDALDLTEENKQLLEKKPGAIKAINILSIIKLASIVLVVLTYGIIESTLPEGDPVRAGLHKAFAKSYHMDSADAAYNFGLLIGMLTVPALLATLTLVFVRRRKFVPLVIVASLAVLAGFGQGGVPLIQIAVLFLVLAEPARGYLKRGRPSV